jgi:carbonic anhydrase/acetyltransferase-like protein (isoleucine patch superfamily)
MSLHNAAHWPEILFERFRERMGFLWQLEARLKGATIHGRILFGGRPILSVARGSRMVFGDRVMLRSGRRNNPLSCFQPCVLRTLDPSAELILETNVGASAATICASRSIRIGENTIIGAGAMILDNDLHRRGEDGLWPSDSTTEARAVLIGRSVFIGARAIVLKGVTIGDGAVVGAGAVVTRDVPAGHLAVGNPAQVRSLRETMPPVDASQA